MTKSTRRIVGVTVAAAVVLVVAWYVALMSPQSHHLAAAHTARAAAVQKVGQLNSEVASLQAFVKQIPSDTARLAALQAAFPENPSLDSALNQLHSAAVGAGVKLSSVGPSAPGVKAASAATSAPQSAGGPAITLSLNASGSYPEVMTFIRDLDSMPRVLVIDQLSLAGTSQLTATIGARIFYAGSPTP